MHVLCICLNLQLWLGFRITAFHWGGYTPSSRSVVLPRRLCESVWVYVHVCVRACACIRVYWSPDFWLCRVTNPCNRLRSYAFEPATASVRGRRGAGHLSVKHLSMFKNGDLHLNAHGNISIGARCRYAVAEDWAQYFSANLTKEI